MTRLDDMKQALASLRRAGDLMEQDVRREEGRMETNLKDRLETLSRADLLIELGKVGKALKFLEMADLLTRQEQDERDRLRMRREQIRYEFNRRGNGWK